MSKDIVHKAHFKVTTDGILRMFKMFIKEGDKKRALGILEVCGVTDYSSIRVFEKYFPELQLNGTINFTPLEEKALEELEIEVRNLESTIIACNRLVNELIDTVGGDWRPRVHYNSGWHYTALLGSIGVSEYERDNNLITKEVYYLVSINGQKGVYGGTPSFWHDHDSYRGNTPKEAVEKAMSFAESVINGLKETLDDNKKLMGK